MRFTCVTQKSELFDRLHLKHAPSGFESDSTETIWVLGWHHPQVFLFWKHPLIVILLLVKVPAVEIEMQWMSHSFSHSSWVLYSIHISNSKMDQHPKWSVTCFTTYGVWGVSWQLLGTDGNTCVTATPSKMSQCKLCTEHVGDLQSTITHLRTALVKTKVTPWKTTLTHTCTSIA